MVAYRKRKTNNKRPMRRPIPRTIRNKNISYIARTASMGIYQMAAVTDTWAKFDYVFRLSNLPGFGEITSMFDQYKITGIKITVYPRYRDQTLGQGTSAVAAPQIWICESDDGSDNLSTKIQAMQMGKARRINDPYKPFSKFIRPKFLVETAVGVGIAASHSKSGWLDTDNNQVNHYGFSIGGDCPGYGTTSFNPLAFDLYAKYYMQCKDPR